MAVTRGREPEETLRNKEYLQRGWHAEGRVKAREDQLEVLRDRMARVRSAAPSPAGDRRGPRRDWTEAVDALADAETAYLKEIAELCRVQREIRLAVETVGSALHRELLEYRYIYCLGWEEIAKRLGYDKRYVFKLHDRALREMGKEKHEGA